MRSPRKRCGCPPSMTLMPIEKKRVPHGVTSQCTPSSTTVCQRECGASLRSVQAPASLPETITQMMSTRDLTTIAWRTHLERLVIERHEHFEFDALLSG